MTWSVVPAIVIAAHDRPDELSRLCRSVCSAEIAPETALIISIDGGSSNQSRVSQVAAQVRWPHGPFKVIEHHHLGLVDHFHACGDLTAEHEAVVFLEDDLVVGPAFHRWATAALELSRKDDRIAGVSLATPHFDGYRHLPFEPIVDGSDGLYAQVPWYDGMAWTADMWGSYRSTEVDPATPVHRHLGTLDDDEWFPHAMRYLVATGRYYLLPRHAHATNSGATGTHFAQSTNYFQVPLTLRGPSSWRLEGLDDAVAVYDDHLELSAASLQRLVPSLAEYDLAVDLLGMRDLQPVRASHLLTTREVRHPIRSWGSSMHPLVANLVHNAIGDTIRLAAIADVVDSDRSDAQSLTTLTAHATRDQVQTDRHSVRRLAARFKDRWPRGR